MPINNPRSKLQTEVIRKAESSKNQLLSWATGVGKTMGFISIQEALNPSLTYIIVAERAHIKNWEDEYKKHGKEHLLAKTKIFCYASLHKYVNTSCNLLCNDECHHITELRADYLASIKTDHVVNLSATTTEEDRSFLEELWGPLCISEVTLNDAIKLSIIAEPVINLIPLELNNTTRSQIAIYTRGKEALRKEIYCNYPDRWKYLRDKKTYPNIKLCIYCTEKEKYQYLSDQVDMYKRLSNKSKRFELMMKKAGLDRKNYLASLKEPKAKEVINQLVNNKKRFICFCGSIELADKLGGTNVVHSKVKDPIKVVERFNNGEIDSLHVVNMLKEGQNLENIHEGLIIQLDKAERSFIQRAGRALRNKDSPKVTILYYKNTQDEVYLNESLVGIDKKYIIYDT